MDFEQRLLYSEGPLTDALDVLHGEANWTEFDADALSNAIVAAIERARDDAR